MENICDDLRLEDLPNEIWRDVVGFDGSHSVSNFGRVKREQRYDTKGRLLKPKILKRTYCIGKDGFKDNAKVSFGANDIVVNKAVSILVAESFLGEIKDKHCVIHIDKDVTNDKLENLKIGTYSESLELDYKTKAKRDWGFGKVGNIGRNKKVIQIDLEGNIVAEFESLGEIERTLNFSKHPIADMCRGRWKDKPHYTCYGYRWKYKENN